MKNYAREGALLLVLAYLAGCSGLGFISQPATPEEAVAKAALTLDQLYKLNTSNLRAGTYSPETGQAYQNMLNDVFGWVEAASRILKEGSSPEEAEDLLKLVDQVFAELESRMR